MSTAIAAARVMLRSCSLGGLRGVASARSLRPMFAAARRSGSAATGRLRTLATASLAAAQQQPPQQQQDAVPEGAEGMSVLAAAGVLEPRLTWPARSHGCGAVTEGQVGQPVTVCGWVDRYRNLGGLLFLDIRDHTGTCALG